MPNEKKDSPEPQEVLRVLSQLYERLEKQTGLTWSQWLFINNLPEARKNLGFYMREGCPAVSEEGLVGLNKEIIAELFEDDFINPVEVNGVFGFEYSSHQLASLDSRLPSTRLAIKLYKLNCALVPGPPQHMTFQDMLSVKDYPLRPDGCVSGDQSFFAVEDVQACRWMAIGKGSLAESSGRPVEVQETLLSEGIYVPTAIEAHYCYTLYSMVRGNPILPRGERVRTASESRNGNRVIIAPAREHEYRISDVIADTQFETDVGLAYGLKC